MGIRMKIIPCVNDCDILEQVIKTNDMDTKIERIYIGSYFCGNYFLHIKLEDIKTLLSHYKDKIRVTLVIPMFSQHHLEQGKRKLSYILENSKNVIDEITVNDYGMLSYIRNTYDIKINLGRLFMKDYRDPRYGEYFQQVLKPKIFTNYLAELCRKYGIEGMEFDPTHQVIDFSKAPKNISIGIHTPLCYLTTGQICEFASIPKKTELKYRPNTSCQKECQSCHLTYVDDENLTWYRWGRAIYFKNEEVCIQGVDTIREIRFPLEKVKGMDGQL